MSLSTLATKFVASLSAQLINSTSFQLSSKDSFHSHIVTVFSELNHAALKTELLKNVDEHVDFIWAQYEAKNRIPLASDGAFSNALSQSKSPSEILELCLVPFSPVFVQKAFHTAVLKSIKVADEEDATKVFSLLVNSVNNTMTSDVTAAKASHSMTLLLTEMAAVYEFIVTLPSNWLSYLSLSTYANICCTKYSQSYFLSNPHIASSATARRFHKIFVKHLLCLYTLVLRSMPVTEDKGVTSLPVSSARSFLAFVAVSLQRIPTAVATTTLATCALDLTELLLLGITLQTKKDTMPDLALLLRVPAVCDIILTDVLARDAVNAASPCSPLKNALSALRAARILRSFSALGATLKTIMTKLPSATAIVFTEDKTATVANAKTAVIALGKLLQKHAAAAGTMHLPTTLLPSLPSLVSLSLRLQGNESGQLSPEHRAALAHIPKDVFSFLLRSGMCSIDGRAIDKLISKLRVEGKSVLQKMAQASAAMDAEKEVEDESEAHDMGMDALDEIKKSRNIDGLASFLDGEEEEAAEIGVNANDGRDMLDDEDLFYEDVDGDSTLRDDLSSLIAKTRTEKDDFDEATTTVLQGQALLDEEEEEEEEEEAVAMKREQADGDVKVEEDVKEEAVKDNVDDGVMMFNIDDVAVSTPDMEEEEEENAVDKLQEQEEAETIVQLPEGGDGPSSLELALHTVLAATAEEPAEPANTTKSRARASKRTRSREPVEEEEVKPLARRRSARLSVPRAVEPVSEVEEEIKPVRRSTRARN